MPGASSDTRRITHLNANWTPDLDGGDGQFQIMLITDDDQRTALPTSPPALTALVALATAGTVLAWDPTNQTLIAANIVGEMPWTTRL